MEIGYSIGQPNYINKSERKYCQSMAKAEINNNPHHHQRRKRMKTSWTHCKVIIIIVITINKQKKHKGGSRKIDMYT